MSIKEGHSTSTPQVESNEPQVPTFGSSQPETDSIPITAIQINSEGDEVLPKDKLRSVHWEHFDRIRVKGMGPVKARCIYCKKKLVADAKSGTTHLKDHFNSCMKRKLLDSKQKFLTSSFSVGDSKVRKLEAYSFNQEEARKQLACMIIMHEYPLSMGEHVGFKRYSNALQPLFHMVSRNTIKKDILKIYDVERTKTMMVIERIRSKISLTTDMWTASNQKRGYMVITAHFIDDSWKLQSRIIRFIYVPCPHTAEVLCEALMDTCLEWNIDRKLSTLTVDNASTNDAMVALLLEKFGSDHMWCKSLFHVRCVAHILNLIVKDGLDVIKASIEKVRESVAFWTSTPKREEKFEDVARQLGITHGKKLSLDCPTRWNSTFLMLKVAVEYKAAFDRLKLKDSHYKCFPSEDDWDFASDMCDRLKVFYEITELFSGSKYPTSNLFFANVCRIKLQLRQWVDCEIDVVVAMAFKMIEKYDKYWDNIQEILGVAAVLDPRFKMTLIEYYFTRIYGGSAFEMVEKIRARCYNLLTVYQGKKNKNSSQSSSKAVSTSTGGGDVLSDFDLFVHERKKCKTSHMKSELDHYLEEDVLPRSENFDILAWWKFSGVKYPTLQDIARDVLSIPVSTVASESSFSTSGRVVSPNRNRLHPKTLEALMCAQSWLLAFENGGEPGTSFPTINDDDVDGDCCISCITSVDD